MVRSILLTLEKQPQELRAQVEMVLKARKALAGRITSKKFERPNPLPLMPPIGGPATGIPLDFSVGLGKGRLWTEQGIKRNQPEYGKALEILGRKLFESHLRLAQGHSHFHVTRAGAIKFTTPSKVVKWLSEKGVIRKRTNLRG
ncbi:hypothetical protein AUJ65_06400 [Candidatus Micrarchaeota archaeon CG1_02_51_15]|nr:MAG: hypothetical protein AUJ65_06400 [Candidatus Micrarchaeota archaeon CG1_02_51_15]